MRIVVVLMLIAIVASLGSAGYANRNRMPGMAPA